MAYETQVDRINDALDMYQKQKEVRDYQTPKEVRRASKQENLAANYANIANATFNNTELQAQYSNFNEYYGNNLHTMDAETIEMMDMTRDSFVNTYRKNAQFAAAEDQIVDFNKRIGNKIKLFDSVYNSDVDLTKSEYNNYINQDEGFQSLLKKPELYVQTRDGGENVLNPLYENPEDYNKATSDYTKNKKAAQREAQQGILNDIRDMTAEFGKFKIDMYQTHAERMQLDRAAGEGGVDGMLKNQEEYLRFVWDSAKEDYLIDSQEWKAYNDFMDTGDYQHINDYLTNQDNTKAQMAKEHLTVIQDTNLRYASNLKASDTVAAWDGVSELQVQADLGDGFQWHVISDADGASTIADKIEDMNVQDWNTMIQRDSQYYGLQGISAVKNYKYENADAIRNQSDYLGTTTNAKKLEHRAHEPVDKFERHPGQGPEGLEGVITDPNNVNLTSYLPTKTQLVDFYGTDDSGFVEKPSLEHIMAYVGAGVRQGNEWDESDLNGYHRNQAVEQMNNPNSTILENMGSQGMAFKNGAEVKDWLNSIFAEGQQMTFMFKHSTNANNFYYKLGEYYSAKEIGDKKSMTRVMQELQELYKEASIYNTPK